MRTLTYTYDGLQRLIGAVESPGSSYAYQYDLAGNRTQVAANGATTQQHTYDAANQVQGWTYDPAGNLTGDGTSTNSYDALGRLTAGASGAQGSTYSYNGDGTLVGQATGGVTTGYAQDVAGGQSQVLAIATGSGAGAGTVDQLWGLDRLASLNPTTGARAWYGYDGQGSARQLLNDAGHVTASASYDPYGTPEGAALPSPFGYTGELTDPATGSQYLRARWYRPGQGTLLGVDPALDSTGKPYSYASDNPANASDPSGQCTFPGGQLAGIAGAGSCEAAIGQDLASGSSTVGGAVQANQAAFGTILNQELANASLAANAGASYVQAQALNPGQCPNPDACSVAAFSAASAAAQTPDHVLNAGGVVARNQPQLTGVFLGVVTGTGSLVSVAVLVINGVVVIAVSVRAPGHTGPPVTLASCGGLGLFAAIAVRLGTGAATGAAEGSAVPGAGTVAGMIALTIATALPIAFDLAGRLPRGRNDFPCNVLRVVCFSKGARPEIAVPVIAANIERGQALGLPRMLTYLGRGNPQQKLNRDLACDKDRQRREYGRVAGGGTTCDEYPFASTFQGGANTVIAEVSGAENSKQGGILSGFYGRTFGYVGGPLAKFVVIIVE